MTLMLFMVLTADAADYLRDIKPVLKARCFACHGALKQKAGLRLDTAANIRKGAKGAAVVVPGNPADSELLSRLTSKDNDDRMPPEGAALKAEEIAAIRDWIADGAPVPKGEIAEADPRVHWAFQMPTKMPLPGDAGNPIDVILDDRRATRGLKTQPEAERTILLRRLYLDLIGLPPTREQLDDRRPWNEIVDALLNNPQHGERWGRHWMDVWRYTDWYGLGAQLRNSQKHIWHWRDWIVESLNADKGYDRMILEMLAADELAPEDPKALRATGFLARNYYLFNRTTWLDATIEHTGKAFIGLTLNCAKCHDHKYDPITHKDYYRFRAIFEPHQVRLDPVPGVTDFEQDGLPRVFDNHLDIKTYLHLRGDPKTPDTNHVMQASVPAILSSFAPKIEPVQLPISAFAPAARDYVKQDRLKLAQAKVDAAKTELAAAKTKVANAPNKKPASEKPSSATPTPEFAVKDDFNKPNPKVWEVFGKGWEFKDGALHQTIPTRDAERLVLRQPVPRDFEITCRYTHTGGALYKSVTFRFDVTPDRKYANFVYTSAHEPGPKLHVAYQRNGESSYPAEGRVVQPIKIGTPYTLRFAVRDRLVNVWLNEKFQIGYTLPDRKPGGRLELSGFDATVAFDDISIRSLPAEVKLVESNDSTPSAKPATSVQALTAKLAAAEAQLISLKAIFVAERLVHNKSHFKAASRVAAKREAEAMRAAGEYELLAAGKDANKVKAARTTIAGAEKKLAAAAKGAGGFTPIRAAKKALETPAHKEAQYPTTYPETSTGRRLALARWIASNKNPLTARVAVNHVWLRHFGEPLVESVFDFGLRAKQPMQVELLDTLAVEFMESGWSFRHLHRLIVTSRAYRLSSTTAGADAKTLVADPNNHFYWRMNNRRMEAQVVRDSLLHLAGVLDPKMGGPSINPGDAARRRSLYFKHSRDQQDKLLKMFNDADHLQCYRRTESIVPQQALALSNSKLAIEMSGLIAQKIKGEKFVDGAFEILLGRKPNPSERQECLKALAELEAAAGKAKKANPKQRARRGLVHALLNHNDFVSVR
ncbi:MAG: PSD1 domain-containing protein [Verrucomicrobia subdivision 3 bacterium]|nr:PSD1 domain-containing protein [Limisphaerales bacterium]